MVQAFRYAFYVMTAISIAAIVMGWFLRDHLLEEHMGRLRRGAGVAAGIPSPQPLISKPNES
jgi:hypothetical protein